MPSSFFHNAFVIAVVTFFSILFLVDSILDSWSLDFWTPFFLLSTFLLFSIFLPIFLLSDLPFQSLFTYFSPF